MIVFLLVIGICLVVGAILAAIVFHFIKHDDFVCCICGDKATWVWRIEGHEQLICDWHNAQLQTEYRGNRPERRLGDAPQS